MSTDGTAGADFPALLRSCRARAGMTQAQLAGLSTLSVRAVRDLELGRVHRPRTATVRLLADALRIEGTRRTRFEDAALGRAGRPADEPPAAPVPPPTALHPLIGREPEVAALTRLFLEDGGRAATVVGLAGVGKTRLALAVADRLHRAGGYSVVFVAPGAGPAGADRTPADAVGGLLAAGGRGAAELAALLAPGRTLLVLDGVAAPADLVLPLLSTCPDLRILATAQQPRPDEPGVLFPLGGLELPAPGDPADPAAGAASLRLLLHHVRRCRPGAGPGAGDLESLRTVCHLLDGLPAALELAASWSLVAAPRQLARRVATDPFLVTAPIEGPAPAGGTLAESLARAVSDLDPRPRALLAAAAGLRRPWSVPAIGRRTGSDPTTAARDVHALVLRGLLRPVDKACFEALNLVRHRLDGARSGPPVDPRLHRRRPGLTA